MLRRSWTKTFISNSTSCCYNSCQHSVILKSTIRLCSTRAVRDFCDVLHFSADTREFLKTNNIDSVAGIERLSKEQVSELISPLYKRQDEVSSLEDVNIRTFFLFNQVVRLNETELRYFLCASAEQGEALALRCALATGRLSDDDVNQVKDQVAERTLLFIACMRGHLDCVKNLIELGAEVDGVQAKGGYSCLRIACENNHHDVVDLLLRAGADPNRRSSSSEILPIHVVASQGHWNLVSLLSQKGANVNQLLRVSVVSPSNTSSTTASIEVSPLAIATQQGHSATVAALLDAGADPTFVATIPSTTTTTTKNNDDDDDLIIFGRSSHQQQQRSTALLIASDMGNSDIVKKFLSSHSISKEVKAKLLNESVSVPGLCTPLCAAAMKGHVEVVRALLDGADANGIAIDLNAQQAEGATALFVACQYNYPQIVQMLLRAKCDPNIPLRRKQQRPQRKTSQSRSDSGSPCPTPLCIAIQERNHQVVELLLRTAAETGLQKEAMMVCSPSSSASSSSIFSSTSSSSSVSEENSQNDRDSHDSHAGCAATTTSTSPVFVAASNNDAEMVQLLIEFNCDPDRATAAAGSGAVTPLAIAVYQGFRDVVRVLLRSEKVVASAKKWEMGKFKSLGQLALHKGHSEIFQMLAHHDKTPAEEAKLEREKQRKIAKKMWQI